MLILYQPTIDTYINDLIDNDDLSLFEGIHFFFPIVYLCILCYRL